MKTFINARCPVRVCDIGGWTDTHYYQYGKVTNFAINLYSHVRLTRNKSDAINIISENLDQDVTIRDYRKIEYDGVLDLLKAAVKRMNVQEGIDIFVRSDAPPGCGTGTSASIAVALVGALAKLQGKNLLPFQAARVAHQIETQELGLESGVQDQYAAAYGGICHMDIDYPGVSLARVSIPPSLACMLEARWVLVYLGSRKSSEMHIDVIKKYQEGDPDTVEAHNTLRDLAEKMVAELQAGNPSGVAEIMNANWAAQQLLHPRITSPAIKHLEKLAIDVGAEGFKVNGAGGGGSAVVMAGPGSEYALKKRLLEEKYIHYPCHLNMSGLQIWQEIE